MEPPYLPSSITVNKPSQKPVGSRFWGNFVLASKCLQNASFGNKKCMMKSLTIRNVPDDVYQSISDLARQQHRCMQEQLRIILQRASEVVQGRACQEAAKYRARFQNRPVARSVVEVLREDRSR